MCMLNRSREEIIAKILSTANSPTKRTHIMFNANLSFYQLKKHLGYAQKKGFIQKTESGLLEITDSGRSFLSQYKLLAALLA